MLFDSHRFRCDFVEVLRQFRREAGFLLVGWVLMPEHFHLLIKPEPAESTSRLMQDLNYMHNNPVKRGLVHSPEEWPWSSFRFYYLNDSSLLSMDKLV
jgi:putative transposase